MVYPPNGRTCPDRLIPREVECPYIEETQGVQWRTNIADLPHIGAEKCFRLPSPSYRFPGYMALATQVIEMRQNRGGLR
ncbi:MAG: hypothetical protein QOD94_3135 [Alphaproteobacteria bacterium]|nr:hypothetical protein [Alphaproteobacteria bacterium]